MFFFVTLEPRKKGTIQPAWLYLFIYLFLLNLPSVSPAFFHHLLFWEKEISVAPHYLAILFILCKYKHYIWDICHISRRTAFYIFNQRGCEKYCTLRSYFKLLGIPSCKECDTSACCIFRTTKSFFTKRDRGRSKVTSCVRPMHLISEHLNSERSCEQLQWYP